MLTLIGDIIMLSELDEAPDRSRFERIDLCPLIRRCVERLEPAAERAGVQLSFEGTPQTVCADESQLEELVYNLCDNAIRYNRLGGSVRVMLGAEDGATVLTVKAVSYTHLDVYKRQVFILRRAQLSLVCQLVFLQLFLWPASVPRGYTVSYTRQWSCWRAFLRLYMVFLV